MTFGIEYNIDKRNRCHRKCLKLYNSIIWKWDDALA